MQVSRATGSDASVQLWVAPELTGQAQSRGLQTVDPNLAGQEAIAGKQIINPNLAVQIPPLRSPKGEPKLSGQEAIAGKQNIVPDLAEQETIVGKQNIVPDLEGQIPPLRMHTGETVSGERLSNHPPHGVALVVEQAHWSLTVTGPGSEDCLVCLQGDIPPRWNERTLPEQFQWLDAKIREVVPLQIQAAMHTAILPPVLVLPAVEFCTLPLPVCRDDIPEASLNLLFGPSEYAVPTWQFHLPETEVVVAVRFHPDTEQALNAVFPGFRLLSSEAIALSRFLTPDPPAGDEKPEAVELLIYRMGQHILLAQKKGASLLACNKLEAATTEEILYYALLLDQGMSGKVSVMGFDPSEETTLRPLLVQSFGQCNPTEWLMPPSMRLHEEPWCLLQNMTGPGLAIHSFTARL